MAKINSPDSTSAVYDAMLPYWNKVEAILAGAEKVKAAGELFLPQFPGEDFTSYSRRLDNAKFTNIYADIVATLASKPFANDVVLREGANEKFEALVEDIDGRGNNLTVFASTTFFNGINYAIDWIFVDYTRAKPRPDGRPLTLEDATRQNLRPYWTRIPAKRMLACYPEVIDGREQVVHARILEDFVQRDGYGEVLVQQIRVLNREVTYDDQGTAIAAAAPTWELLRRKPGLRYNSKSTWERVAGGNLGIDEIPLVPYITGQRVDSSLVIDPPLRDALNTQVEHYQEETALKHIKEMCAYPMYAGQGVQPDTDEKGDVKPLVIGPGRQLYAPPGEDGGSSGRWEMLEPSAESLKFLAADIKATEDQLRNLGKQPLVATAGITVVAAAVGSQKSSSVVQGWAFALKDALEQAFVYTAKWLKIEESPEVVVFTDFSLDTADQSGPTTLLAMRAKGDLSRETLWEEAKRRKILSADFDAEKEDERLAAEAPDPDDLANQAAALGLSIEDPVAKALREREEADRLAEEGGGTTEPPAGAA